MTKLLLAACLPLLGCALDDPETAVDDSALTGTSHWEWNGTTSTFLDIGSSINRACILTGVGGNLTTPAAGGSASGNGAGVRINATTNRWELWLSPAVAGNRIRAYARCFASTSLSHEEVWTGGAKITVEPDAAHRRCFITTIKTKRVGNGHGGFAVMGDYAALTRDANNVYLGGAQSGGVEVGVRCAEITSELDNRRFAAGLNLTTNEPMAVVPMDGSVCGLTRVSGQLIDGADPLQGPRIVREADHYEAIAKDGTGGAAVCVN